MTIEAIHSRAYSAQGRENHDRIFNKSKGLVIDVENTPQKEIEICGKKYRLISLNDRKFCCKCSQFPGKTPSSRRKCEKTNVCPKGLPVNFL